jgi:hypothetical protein
MNDSGGTWLERGVGGPDHDKIRVVKRLRETTSKLEHFGYARELALMLKYSELVSKQGH